MDAGALYSSILTEIATELCREAARESVIKVRNINYLEGTRLRRLTITDRQVRKSGLRKVLPIRRRLPGKEIGKLSLTTENSLKPVVNDKVMVGLASG